MDVEHRIELSATIAEYIVEFVADEDPYITDDDGNTSYKDWAQSSFNEHYDVVRDIVDGIAEETK